MSENTVTIDHAALEARFDKALRALLDAYENRRGEAFDNAHDDLEIIGGLLLETVKEQAARLAELEKALEPFANAAASWGPGDASRILSRVRRGYETQPDLCITVGHLLEAQRALGGDK